MASKFTLLAAAAALGLASPTLAQGNGQGDGPPETSQGVGPEVRDIAQDPARPGAIGPQVSDIARDRDLSTPPPDDVPDDGDDAADSRGIGPEVRDLAREPDREGGVGEDVRELARDRDDADDDDEDIGAD